MLLHKLFNQLPHKFQTTLKRKAIAWYVQERSNVREELAFNFLKGAGVELGALHMPLVIPSNCSVKYIDRMDESSLRNQYPELAEKPLVHVDIIDDGESLASLQIASQDFVIACHMIEHTQNPIGSLKNWLRVLKHEGVLFLAVPNKQYTFDIDRPYTTLDHLLKDYYEGPAWSKKMHFEEWVNKVDKINGAAADERMRLLIDMDYSIHFHVWNEVTFLQMLTYCIIELKMPFSIEACRKNHHEFIVVLKKQPIET